jgi:hypothetical protein
MKIVFKTRYMNRASQFLETIFWLGISGIVIVDSIHVGIGTLRSPGPGFLPFCLGIVFGTLAIIIVGMRYLHQNETEANSWEGVEWGRLGVVMVSTLLYIPLFERIGYLIATFALMLFQLYVVEKGRVLGKAILALTVVIASYLLFNVWLEVRLPKGLLNF